MLVPAPSRMRTAFAVLLATAGASYALFGNELVSRVGTVFDRAGRRVGNATENLQTRAESDRLEQTRAALDKLLACRETLAAQVKSLGEHRAVVARRLDQDSSLLRRVLAGLDKGESREVSDRDAAEVLRRVRSDEDEITKCDAELRRLTESLDQLDRNIDQAAIVVQQQSDELERRKMGATGRRAYEDGRDLTNQIVKSSR